MSDDNDSDIPKIETTMPTNTAAEWGLALAKAGASVIPVAGGTVAELLNVVIMPRIEQRKTEWLESIARSLVALRERVTQLTPERLSQNEAFTTTFLHASQIALRTHQEEKRQALLNTVLNVAIGDAPDDSLQLMFLDALDTLTPWHLNLLKCVANPLEWAAQRDYPVHVTNPDAAIIFEGFYRDKLPAENFHLQLLEDLYSRGLAANNINPRGQLFPHSEEDMLPHITDMGRKFLAFIATPKPLTDEDAANESADAAGASG